MTLPGTVKLFPVTSQCIAGQEIGPQSSQGRWAAHAGDTRLGVLLSVCSSMKNGRFHINYFISL